MAIIEILSTGIQLKRSRIISNGVPFSGTEIDVDFGETKEQGSLLTIKKNRNN